MISVYIMMEMAASFIEILFCCLVYGALREKNSTVQKILIASFFGTIVVSILNSISLFSIITTLIGIILFSVIQKILYHDALKNILVLVLSYLVIISAIDFLVIQVISILSGVSTQTLLNEESNMRMLCLILSKFFLILLSTFIMKFLKSYKELQTKHVACMCIIAGFSMLSNFILIELNLNSPKELIEALSIIYFIISIVVVFSSFYLFMMLSINDKQKQTLELLDLQNHMVIKSQNEAEHIFSLWRTSIHDHKNHIIALKNLADKNDLSEIKKYLETEYQLMDQKLFYYRTGNSVVDSLINAKQNIAEKNGIKFTVNANLSDKLFISEFDMASILGNLLDNALEAVLDEKEPYLEIIMKEEKNFIMIKLQNSFSGTLPKDLITTKKKDYLHGLGIKSIENLVQKYGGEFTINQNQNNVTTMVMLPNYEIRD